MASASPRLAAAPRRGGALRFWLRDIWGPRWDRERRALLLQHYRSHLQSGPVPAEHAPSPDPAAIAGQRQFSDHYRRRVESVQHGAASARPVRLTYRPIGKNIRLVGTAIRHHVDLGCATEIMSDGPPTEVAALASEGRTWSPWLWSRTGNPTDAARCASAADGWREFFAQPSRTAADGWSPMAPPPRWRGPGCGAFTPARLERTLKLAVATRYAFTPTADLEAQLVEWKRAAGWPAAGVPVLGMHVRRSDAASTEPDAPLRSNRRSFGMSQYLDAADTLCTAYGIRHIFLATESSVEVARAAALRPQYTFLTVAHDRALFPDITVNGQYIEERALARPEIARPLALSAIRDLQLFADCQAFVGAFNSEFSLLAWLLAVGGQGHLVPHISLSRPAAGIHLHPHDALLNLNNNCPLELYHW
ncbi:MAG: hypothetical protein WC815_14015 [Vicinamibacterales bacterium]